MDIVDYIPTGHDNGVTMRDLESLTGFSNRDIRKHISQARKEGTIILNLQDGNGYFKPTNDEADYVRKFMKQEHSRAMDVLISLNSAKAWLSDSERGVFDGAKEG